jgi:hypothetical protein
LLHKVKRGKFREKLRSRRRAVHTHTTILTNSILCRRPKSAPKVVRATFHHYTTPTYINIGLNPSPTQYPKGRANVTDPLIKMLFPVQLLIRDNPQVLH